MEQGEIIKFIPERAETSPRGRLAIEAALTGGNVLVSSVGGKVEEKEGISNVVTEGDKKADQSIRDLILSKFPNDLILSEENTSQLKDPLSAEYLWIIDPLDGSKNYSDNLPEVWVSVAFAQKGELRIGAIYNPFYNQMYFAELGKGAHYRGPKSVGEEQIIEEELMVSQKDTLDNSSIETSISYNAQQTVDHQIVKLAMYLNDINPRFREIGSSVGQLARIARGQSDLHFHSGLKPWDIAAGMILIHEARGITKGMNGENITFMSPHTVSGNPILVDQLVEVIKKIKGDQELISQLEKRIKDFNIS